MGEGGGELKKRKENHRELPLIPISPRGHALTQEVAPYAHVAMYTVQPVSQKHNYCRNMGATQPHAIHMETISKSLGVHRARKMEDHQSRARAQFQSSIFSGIEKPSQRLGDGSVGPVLTTQEP